MPRFAYIVALITSVFLLAGGFIAARFYFQAGGVPLDIAALRYATAGLLLLPFGLLGLVVLVGPAVMGSDTGGAWWAELAYMVAGCLWAVFTVLLRLWKIAPLQGSALAATFSLPLIVLWWFLGESAIASVPLQDTLLQAAYQGVGFAIAGIALYGFAVKNLGASAAVAAMPLMPAFATLGDWWLFDGPLNLRIVVALIMMTGCVLIIASVRRKPLVMQPAQT